MQYSFTCHRCGAVNIAGQKQCTQCGQAFHYNCRNCGAYIDNTYANCPGCGVALYWPSYDDIPQAYAQQGGQQPENKRNPLVIIMVGIIVVAVIAAGALLAVNVFKKPASVLQPGDSLRQSGQPAGKTAGNSF